jgi:hypothetical protein
MGELGAADADGDGVPFLGDGAYHFQMPLVEGLESTEDQGVRFFALQVNPYSHVSPDMITLTDLVIEGRLSGPALAEKKKG